MLLRSISYIALVVLVLVVPRGTLAQDSNPAKSSLAGTWLLKVDWGKGKDAKEQKYFLTVNEDLSGSIKDPTDGWVSSLKSISIDGDAMNFAFLYADKPEFEIKFRGTGNSSALRGKFTAHGANATVTGSPIDSAKIGEVATKRSFVDSYKDRRHTSSEGVETPFRLFVPTNYDPNKKYPLVLFHHGGGGGGSDNRRNLEGALVREWIRPDVQAKHACFIVAPQMPGKKSKFKGDPKAAIDNLKEHIRGVQEILDRLEKEFSIDTKRQYVTGLSFGGECTWLSLIAKPDRFAAAVPICAGDRMMEIADKERGQRFANLPIWIFHGDADRVISVDVSRRIVKALRDAGGEPKYSEYQGVNHNSWDPAYRDPKLVEWLFAQSRK